LSEIQIALSVLHFIWQPKYKEKPTEPITEPDLYPFYNSPILIVLPFTDFQGYYMFMDLHPQNTQNPPESGKSILTVSADLDLIL